MARHRPAPSKQPTGLFSHVLSFVSREFESFVVNATGGPTNQNGHAKPSSGKRSRDSERGEEARVKSRPKHHRGRESRLKRQLLRPKPRSRSTDSAPEHVQPTHVDDDRANERERSNSPTPRPPSIFPVPPPPKLRKQPSITMPGALFPRSPSLVPDLQHMASYPQAPFFAKPSHPLHGSGPDAAEAGPSSMHSTAVAVNPDQPSLDQYVSPWRTRPIASVKDAVERFSTTEGAEADFSLMLPSPHSSPAKSVSKGQSSADASPRRTSVSSMSTSRKGKGRARDDDDLDYIVCGSSGQDGVYAKERELDAAREEQRDHERRSSGDHSRRALDESERDKQRIKVLEEEVRWLKEELCRSQTRSSPRPDLVPPPPPPPPPPPLPLRIDTMPLTPTSMFATARASLRHAMTPVEAPINNPGLNRTKRHGQPAVNMPSEKMAAFLHEIKTAKLRRVGSGTNAMGGDGIAGPSGLSKSLSVAAIPASTNPAKLSAKELLRRRSLASLRVPIGSSLAAPVPLSALAASKGPDARVGQKRKADVLDADEAMGAPTKRRLTQSSSHSSSAMSQHTATSSSESSLSLLPRPPTNETDVTTPSLCSDNDRDENSIEDHVPSTPPGPRAATTAQKGYDTDAQIDVIDVNMEEPPHSEPRTISADSMPRRTSDLFKKRPPTSPLPIPTPRRPSAPARTKRGATPRPKLLPSSDSDDEETHPRAAPVPFVSLIPVSKLKPTKPKAKPVLGEKGRPRAALQQENGHLSASSGSGSSSQNKHKRAHKRRQTLDEELRSAEARSSDMDECNDELDPEKKEDVFTATGTKSKRKGFLAHGGGGGAPIFMGVGYVQGAERDSTGEEEEDGEQPRGSSKPASQLSLIPRPKSRRNFSN